MRAKERAQNVGAGYSSGRKELPAREAGLVCAPESALPSWGCDRGWRAGAMLRSRSTQEMDGGENKVDEMKVARPPVFVNVHLGPSALVALLSRVALFGARNGWLRLGGATLNLEADGWPLGESSSASLRRPARCSLRSTATGALLCALCLRQFRRSRPRSANSPHAFSPPPCAHPPRAVRAKIVGLAQTPFGVFGSHSSTGGASRLGPTGPTGQLGTAWQH